MGRIDLGKGKFINNLNIACSSLEEILEKTEKVIKEENLGLKVPLVKEMKTHIVVAKAFITGISCAGVILYALHCLGALDKISQWKKNLRRNTR